MAKTSKTMLSSSGESGHPCLVPNFKGNIFNFSPLRIMFAVGLSYMAFIMLRYVLSPVLLPGKSHGWRSLVAAVHGVAKSWTRLSDFTFTFHFHALEKEMETHSSVLAWRIPGKGEPGGLPSMGLHRVGHN